MLEAIRNLVKKTLLKPIVERGEVDSFLKELKIILLSSDVPPDISDKIVREIRHNIEKIKGVPLRDALLYSTYRVLAAHLGKGKKLRIERSGTKITLIGIYGSGKTTTAAKLALYFKKRGYKVACVQTDKCRPASWEQLQTLCNEIGVKCFDYRDKDIREFNFKKYDVTIIDTAGRADISEDLGEEIKNLCKSINSDINILVIPADAGYAIKRHIEFFNKYVRIDGIIVTRMDTAAKAGGALAASYITGAPIFFIGTGESVRDLEEFDPEGFVSRLLGMGDIKELIKRIEESEKVKKSIERLEEKFDLVAFYEQLEALSDLGGLGNVLSLIPGLSLKVDLRKAMAISEEKLKKWKAIMQSMTFEELENPEIINASRIRRIARGAGVREEDVRELLAAYNQAKKMYKMLRSRDFRKILKMLGLGI